MSEQAPSPNDPASDNKNGGSCCMRRCRCSSGPYRWVRLFVIAGLIAAAIFTHRAHCSPHWLSSTGSSTTIVEAHVEHAAAFIADRVDANDRQRQALQTMSREVADEMQPLIAAHLAARATLYAALSADSIDEVRIEQARSALVQQLDASSREMTGSLIAAGKTLSPAQRRELFKNWQTAGSM